MLSKEVKILNNNENEKLSAWKLAEDFGQTQATDITCKKEEI